MRLIAILSVVCISLALCHPSIKGAKTCWDTNCKIEDNCKCPSTRNPVNGSNLAPQFLALTISESIVETLYDLYIKPIFYDRLNPDGQPIGASFYVNHEYTNYELVQKLYSRGFEIGVHSITKNASQEYWRYASLQDLIEEFEGQREIISNFGNIPIDDVTGARTPQLQLAGDVSIQAYIASGISYDNSWPTMSNDRLFPYTLNYASTQACTATMTCPKDSHPGFWIAPITDIKGQNNVECNSFVTCGVQGSADKIANWLINELNRAKNSNRAPLVLRLDSYWFQFTDNAFEGFIKFLDAVGEMSDVYIISVADVLKWIRNPVALKDYKSPNNERDYDCIVEKCKLKTVDGQIRYMTSCVPCPEVYPWKGNPNGEKDSEE